MVVLHTNIASKYTKLLLVSFNTMQANIKAKRNQYHNFFIHYELKVKVEGDKTFLC